MKTLNPEWNESFDIMIYDKACQFVDFTLYDYDQLSAGDFLGKTTISMACLPLLVEEVFDLDLMDVKTGSLQISCQYSPLKKNTEDKATEEAEKGNKEDILFELSPSMLTSDILEEELDPDAAAADTTGPTRRDDLRSGLMSPPTNKKSFKSMSSFEEGRSPGGGPSAIMSQGVLTVSCIRGRHFQTMHSSFLKKGKHIRPYISLTIGNVKKETVVQKDHHDPNYAEVIRKSVPYLLFMLKCGKIVCNSCLFHLSCIDFLTSFHSISRSSISLCKTPPLLHSPFEQCINITFEESLCWESTQFN